jgi:hypothetical protein
MSAGLPAYALAPLPQISGFTEDLLWIYKIVRLGHEPSTLPASTWMFLE